MDDLTNFLTRDLNNLKFGGEENIYLEKELRTYKSDPEIGLFISKLNSTKYNYNFQNTTFSKTLGEIDFRCCCLFWLVTPLYLST